MITSVYEIHIGNTPHGDDGLIFYTYFVCRSMTGHNVRYDLFRINNVLEGYEVLGRELPLKHCRKIVKEYELHGTVVKGMIVKK